MTKYSPCQDWEDNGKQLRAALYLITALLCGLLFAAAINAAPWDAESGAATLPMGYGHG